MAAVTVFFDTSVLLSAVIDFGPKVRAAHAVMDAVASGRLANPATAWHCCLEFFSVATRLPEEYRLEPDDAVELLRTEIVGRFRVHSLPDRRRDALWDSVLAAGVAGGKIYDLHIAEIARAQGADIVLTENRRDFAALTGDLRVLSAREYALESGLL